MRQTPLEPESVRRVSLESVRQAVGSGEYCRAQLLWQECVAALAEDARLGRLTEARLAEVRELVEWSRAVVLCARVRLLERINTLHVAGEYEFAAPPSSGRLVEARF